MSNLSISDGLSPVIQGDTIRLFANIESGFVTKPILKKFSIAIYGNVDNPVVHVEVENGKEGELDDLTAIWLLGLKCLNTYQSLLQASKTRPN